MFLLARALGGIVAIVGALIVLGWALDEIIVPSGVEAVPAVRANTGVCLLLAGVALVLRRPGRAGLVPRLLGAGVALVGSLTLVEYAFGAELGIDELLFSDPSGPNPGRMAPNTASGFVLLGTALLLPEPRRGRWRVAEPIALIAVVFAWLALLGSAANLVELVQVKDYLRIATPTAVCVVLLGTAITITVSGGWVARLVASEGPAGPLVPRLLLAVLVVPLALALGLRGLHSAGTLDDGAVILLLLASITVTLLAIALVFAVSFDREDQARAAEKERGRAILETARDAIVTADSSGRIVGFNIAAESMFALPVEDALGASLTVLMPERYHDAHEAGMRRFLAGGEARVVGSTVELAGRRSDGEEFPLELSLSAFTQRGETIFTGILNDVSERKEAEEALLRSEAGLRQSQRMARLGSWNWDIATNEVTWSDELYRLYGIAPGEFEASYEGFLERVHPDDRTAMEAAVGHAYSTGEPFDLDHRIVRPDGSVLVNHAHGEVTRDEHGNPVTMAGTGQDVTEQRAAEEQIANQARELKERAVELERSNAELEQFAYVASHDLQEPLRSIGGFVQLLKRRYSGQIDEDADRFIGFTVSGVERMQALIDGLLTYSQEGRGELRREPVDSRALAERTLALLDAALRDAGAEVELGELPTILADEAGLGQVFQNLLANALKFTDGEPPRVEVSAVHTGDAWSFAVADNGIGIDPGHAERIFRIFQRLHAREEYPGTGVGLAVCKRVVERHGGRIWCEARPDGGTVFRFTIPDAEELVT